MTTARKPKPGRHTDLAKIHIGATKVGLIDGVDDSAYRDMLWTIGRVRSAKDLDAAGRAAVLKHLAAIGWADPAAGRSSRPRYQKGSQAALIRHLWTCLARAGAVRDGSDAALRAYGKQQSQSYHPQRAGYDAPELMPAWVAGKVIEHLKAWCERESVPH